MTSRARRIVLAMYGHRAYTPVVVTTAPSDVPPYYTAHCCYEAMDEPDEVTTLAPRVIVGGNYGMLCA